MKHHPVPKAKGGKTKMDSCRDCHKAIHLFFSNTELARTYHTVVTLMSDEPFAKMIAYIAKQDPARKVRMRRMKRRPIRPA